MFPYMHSLVHAPCVIRYCKFPEKKKKVPVILLEVKPYSVSSEHESWIDYH